MKPKEQVQQYIVLFETLLNKSVKVSFGPHVFTTVIESVKLAILGDMENKPDMRQRDGKNYTPPCLLIQCQDGNLYFIMEDIQKSFLTTKGVSLILERTKVTFELI